MGWFCFAGRQSLLAQTGATPVLVLILVSPDFDGIIVTPSQAQGKL